MAVITDTLRLARQLEAAGFSKDQAEGASAAIAAAVAEDRETKTELGWIKWALAVFVAAHLAEISMLVTLLGRIPAS